MRDWMGMIRRGIRKPPRVIVARLAKEARAEIERLRAPWRRSMSIHRMLRELDATDVDSLWSELANLRFPATVLPVDPAEYERLCPGDSKRIFSAAERALAHRVEMLGSGLTDLGEVIDWTRDFRSGARWPNAYFSDIDFLGAGDGSDVKVPWELGRLQWVIPLGQAYLLSGKDEYAEGALRIVRQWIDANPYAASLGWASTMEVALRIFSLTWLFHVFHSAPAWADRDFREAFLRAVYLHTDFIDRHVVDSGINAGVYTVSAAGLVFGGLFFGRGRRPMRWQARGWDMCRSEIERQVDSDGVGFEGSLSYHRLALEFFALPALYRKCRALTVEDDYRARLGKMAHFVAAYTKPDGTAPLLGDDGGTRALPFGGGGPNDHRFVIGMVGIGFGDAEASRRFRGPIPELFWLFGEHVRDVVSTDACAPASESFPIGGYYVMRHGGDHIFIDCAPVGLRGRGGHGHNDCLSFEAMLDGVPLITDRGTYTYTASIAERNAFRSTSSHNTPTVDDEEINRMIEPTWLWALHYDARPEVVTWKADEECALFVGRHGGYSRLPEPVIPERIVLGDFSCHALYIEDRFLGAGCHDIVERFQLVPGLRVIGGGNGKLRLVGAAKEFCVQWRIGSGYELRVEDSPISPAYGVLSPASRLVWERKGAPLATFSMLIAPIERFGEAVSAIQRRLTANGLQSAL